jgi:hypothetical protein
MPTKETTRNGRNAAERLNGWAALTDNTKLLFHNKKFMCILHVGGAVQPKGNGISPEGCRKMRLIFAKHSLIFSALCRSLLVGCCWLCALARRSILHIEFFIVCSEVCFSSSAFCLAFCKCSISCLFWQKSHCFGQRLRCLI